MSSANAKYHCFFFFFHRIDKGDLPLMYSFVFWCKFIRLQNSRFFFSKSVKKSIKRGVRVLRARRARASHALFSASFQTFCLTARAYLNTQKYGLFYSLQFIDLVSFLGCHCVTLVTFVL